MKSLDPRFSSLPPAAASSIINFVQGHLPSQRNTPLGISRRLWYPYIGDRSMPQVWRFIPFPSSKASRQHGWTSLSTTFSLLFTDCCIPSNYVYSTYWRVNLCDSCTLLVYSLWFPICFILPILQSVGPFLFSSISMVLLCGKYIHVHDCVRCLMILRPAAPERSGGRYRWTKNLESYGISMCMYAYLTGARKAGVFIFVPPFKSFSLLSLSFASWEIHVKASSVRFLSLSCTFVGSLSYPFHSAAKHRNHWFAGKPWEICLKISILKWIKTMMKKRFCMVQ